MAYATVFLTVLLAQATAPAVTENTFSVKPQKSLLRYTIVHKFHTVHGESKQVQGKALRKADGTLQVMVRAPVVSFQSGDGNRDEHMRETLEESKYPYIVYKGAARLGAAPSVLPAQLDVVLDGELDFHGRKRAEKVRVHVESSGPGQARATGHFVVSLERYQIERPSLLLMKIEDACTIDFDFQLMAGGR
jgi:polyisoprenoid-binding protein YceI